MSNKQKLIFFKVPILLLAIGALIFAIALSAFRNKTYTVKPTGIMGTRCTLKAVARSINYQSANVALSDAEAALRNVEVRMSRHLESSELSQLNSAVAGEEVILSAETLELLKISKDLAKQTDGAFDVTVEPLVKLWKDCAKENRLPTEQELTGARESSNWDLIQFTDAGVIKAGPEVSLDLGGIAKGFGIDKAIEAMIAADVQGGLIDVGGDIRCFGKPPKGDYWTLGIQNPFEPASPELLETLKIKAGAVCTSGNYHRYSQIQGKRYSHIIDPRTFRPAGVSPSVTVYAPTATLADAWATALSVLGPEGFKLIPPESGIEAMIIIGGPENYKKTSTPGFKSLLE